jgi:hypothetical protein
MYQLVISSMYNTIYNIIQKDFKAKLFSVFSYNYIIKDREMVLASILKDFPLIYDHQNYGFKSLNTYLKWVTIINDPNLVRNATWLQNVFNLNSSQVNSIIGENSYLGYLFSAFNSKWI